MVLVLILAALPRLLALDLAGFDHNQEELLKLVDPIVDEGRWPLVGWEISGRFDGRLPALLFWILALPRFVTSAPAVLIGFGALFDVAAAGLTCVLGRRLFGRLPGLAAGLLYGFEAYLVEHSRILWNVTMLPCFTALLLLGIVLWAVERRPWAVVLVLFSLSCLSQLHLLTAYLLPPVVLVAVLLRPPLSLRPLLVGLALAGGLYVPYGVHEVREGFPNLRAASMIATEVFGERDSEHDQVQARADRATNRAILEKAVVFHRFRYAVDQLPPEARRTAVVERFQSWNRGRSVAFAVGVGVLLAALARAVRDRRRGRPADRWARVAVVLLAFHYLPLLVLSQASFRLYERYVLPIFPVPFLILLVPLAALIEWAPGERRAAAVRSLGLGASLLFMVTLAGTHLELTRFTRALSRELGTIAEAATLGTKTEIARFFRSRGIDHDEFRRRVHFFQWPELELAERGVGYGPIFRWLRERQEQDASAESVPDSHHWIVFYSFEGRHLVPDVTAMEVFEGERFLAATIDGTRIERDLRSTARPDPPWWHAQRSVQDWVKNEVPFTTQRGVYDEPGGERVIYLHHQAQVDEPSAASYLLYRTRACVQGMALDNEFIAGADCPPGDAKEELPTVLRSIDVSSAMDEGTHVLRTKLIPRYVSTWFDAFLMPMQRPDVALEPPFRELLYGAFLYPELYRYRVPEAAPRDGTRSAGRLPRSDEELRAFMQVGADTPVFAELLEDADGPILHIRYDFTGHEAWFAILLSTEPHVDLTDHEQIAFSIRSNGRGGAARLALKELDGDEWEFWEELAMWERDWVHLVVPLEDLERDPYWAQGDHVMDLSFITTVMVQVSPGRRSPPMEGLELWIRAPVLLGAGSAAGD